MTQKITRASLLAQKPWLLYPHTFAAHVSQHSGERWHPYSHLKHIGREVRNTIRKKNGRKIFSLPPRHGKSEFLTHWVPTWALELWPEIHIMIITGDAGLAIDFARKIRDQLTNNPLLTTKVRADTSAASRWMTTAGGGVKAFGIDSSFMGRGADIIILDDIVTSWKNARNAKKQAAIRDKISGEIRSRLAPGGTMFHIMQRWSMADPTEWMLTEHGDNWDEIKFPAIATENDVIGRKPGEALCPERFDIDALLSIKAGTPESQWAALYQQNPVPEGGAIVKEEWLRYYTEAPHFAEVTQSWDLTFGGNGTSYAVGQVWGRTGQDKYLLDQVRKKMGFTEQVEEIQQMRAKWPNTTHILIEKGANGVGVADHLIHSVGIPEADIELVPTEGKGKEERLELVQPDFKNGHVWIPAKSMFSWVPEYVQEICSFPFGVENDDQVDTTSQALRYIRSSSRIESLPMIEMEMDFSKESLWGI